MNIIILTALMLIFPHPDVSAQASLPDSVVNLQNMPRNSVQRAASKLSKSLGENAGDAEVAAGYVMLAAELFATGDYEKSEDYLQRALQIYNNLKDRDKQYEVNRELAKVQEVCGKIDEAVKTLEAAAKATRDKSKREITKNDIQRLKNYAIPENQSEYIGRNITILEKTGTPEEKAVAYTQMAQTNLQMNQAGQAIENYEKALLNVNEKTPEAIQIQNKMIEAYVADEQYDKAVEISKKIIEEAKERSDAETQIGQMQAISNFYIADSERGIEALTEAYNLALESGNTMGAKNTLELLVAQYLSMKDYRTSIDLCKGFLSNLETLIKADSSLVDARIFQMTEERIDRLEKEKALTEQLIREKNIFNRVLMGSIALMFVLLLFIAKALRSIRIKNKKIALQALRREMNPHFIFNSLNSVNQFIAQNNELEANRYLSSYSKLMRNMMENSNRDFIRLSKEIEHLTEYLELERLRFGDKFTFEIFVDEQIETESAEIPNMLIQPHLENAVWHGLRYKETSGSLSLKFLRREKDILVIIGDNGIGLTQSREIKTKNQKVHESRGLKNIDERIKLLNKLYNIQINCRVAEKEPPQSGVIVEIRFPVLRIEKQTP
ncbi:MAG: histidine kinase [Prolixibacteraceae bacterium]|nr:histidine kinase [Prolixibacteraceae bacterium]